MRLIRLWKLGSLEHKIIPSQEAIDKLRSILDGIGDGGFDIIWGPDLELEVYEEKDADNTDGDKESQ